jgi:hypothetical protein
VFRWRQRAGMRVNRRTETDPRFPLPAPSALAIVPSSMRTPQAADVEAFYRASLDGLRFLESREGKGRRFGEAALAAWQALGGELEPRDRLDLLLRDAAVTHPLAFSPRLVFELAALTDDEPFGPEWLGAPARLAETLLRDGTARGELDTAAVIAASAKRWGLPEPTPSPAAEDQVGRVTAAAHIVLTGMSAMLALTTAAAGRRDWDLAEQVVLIADSAAERQLWGIALLATPSRKQPRVLTPADATPERVRELGIKHLDVAMVSEDAGPESQRAAGALFGELGG